MVGFTEYDLMAKNYGDVVDGALLITVNYRNHRDSALNYSEGSESPNQLNSAPSAASS